MLIYLSIFFSKSRHKLLCSGFLQNFYFTKSLDFSKRLQHLFYLYNRTSECGNMESQRISLFFGKLSYVLFCDIHKVILTLRLSCRDLVFICDAQCRAHSCCNFLTHKTVNSSLFLLLFLMVLPDHFHK